MPTFSTERVTDRSPRQRHGRTVNLPARAVTGFNWTGDVLDWRAAPEQYGAIHFHADDLEDAEWEESLSFTVPEGTPSGIYAARLRAGDAGSTGSPGWRDYDNHIARLATNVLVRFLDERPFALPDGRVAPAVVG